MAPRSTTSARFRRVLMLMAAGAPLLGGPYPRPASAAEPSEADAEFFEKSVRPILAEHCFSCHGPQKQKANLRLDSAEALAKGSDTGPVVKPGDPAGSRLIIAITYVDVDLQMPPKGKLPEQAIKDLKRWVEMGAPWPASASATPKPASPTKPDAPANSEAPAKTVAPGAGKVEPFDLIKRRDSHWAWRPIAAAEPPAPKDADWARTATDKFILAKLEGEGLKPAPAADRATLLRRVHFDLTGLPPTPAEVDAFVADASPDALAKVVDSLLASPRFGERWARRWLDLARFAESYGHEQDFPILHATRYRDYVIRAFNADVPYDQFLTEQIAGDLLPNPRRNPDEDFNESVIGTGFFLLGQGTHAPVDVRQDMYDRIDNQIDVMTKTFMGLTVACARCHDHKFDAISAKDYYSLTGFLESSRRQYAPLDPGRKIETAARELADEVRKGAAVAREAAHQNADRAGRDFGDYLLAGTEALKGSHKEEDGLDALRPNIAFEDFQNGYGAWTTRGTGFGPEPFATKEGARFASSGDPKTTGTLLSRPFAIERDFIRLRVAGTQDKEKFGARLLIDGKAERTSSGRGGEEWRDIAWNVADLAGRVARVEIYDLADNGTIMVDQIEFAQRGDGLALRRPIDKVAAERDLDPKRLDRWAVELNKRELAAPENPLAAWSRVALAENPEDRKEAAADWNARHKAWSAESAKLAAERAAKTDDLVFADFNKGDFSGWTHTGEAFGSAPTRAETWTPVLGPTAFAPAGVAHSGLVARELRGVLRSPEFTITKDKIAYRIAGENALVRLVIDGYTIREFTALLFRDCQFNVNTDGQYLWLTQKDDVGKYKGERAHIEIVDDGHGWVAVDEIRFIDGAPMGDTPDPASTASINPEALAYSASNEALARAYGSLVARALREIETPGAAPGAAAARWALDRGLLDLGPANKELEDASLALRQTGAKIPDPVFALALLEGDPVDERVFIRGGYKNPGDPAPRRFLEAISGPDQPPVGPGSGRLELARRMLDPANPLPARVMVNRVWAALFGRGIVATVDNFGALGEAPTHPELLDWLANDFRRDGWSVKRLIRNLVLSSAYQMSSDAADVATETKDPTNALLHRMRVRRLEGEAIRDSILAVSGRLDPKMFGDSVTVHMTPFMYNGRNEPESGPIDGNGRRSIYIQLRRNFLPPMLLTFDMPTPDSTVGRRTVSNVPGQALTLLNDPFVIEQAEIWAKRDFKDGADEPAWRRVERMFLEAFGRKPTDNEIYRSLAFLNQQAQTYGLKPEDAEKDERVWADLGHTLFTLKEFIFIG